MSKRRWMALCCLISAPVWAQTHDNAKTETQTDAWLALQRSGEAASPHRQQASFGERERSLERWLKSFEHPIPEFYEVSSEIGGGQ